MRDPIGRIISSIYRHKHVLISRALISGQCPIGPGQIYVFAVIATDEGLHQKDIVKALMLEKATVAKAVKRLQEDGYVRTEEDPHDKRYTKVFLNAEGRRIFPVIKAFFKEVDQILLKGLSEKEVESVYSLNERMNRNLIRELSNR
jgi:DNA-binding MarR family transcriptional regulator